MDCLFCKIVTGTLNTRFVHEDDALVAFQDISAQAPHHILIVPKRHIATLNDCEPEDATLLGSMMLTAKNIAKQLGLSDEGYRVLMNCNQHGGQSVYHIHMHLLGGRQMHWPPG